MFLHAQDRALSTDLAVELRQPATGNPRADTAHSHAFFEVRREPGRRKVPLTVWADAFILLLRR